MLQIDIQLLQTTNRTTNRKWPVELCHHQWIDWRSRLSQLNFCRKISVAYFFSLREKVQVI